VIVVIAATQPVDGFVLVNTTGSGYIRIGVGVSGTLTPLSATEYCALDPTDPACLATTTTAPPTSPPAVDTNRRGLTTEVALEPGDDPVPQQCVVALDSVEVVPVGVLDQRLGVLTLQRMRQVCAALEAAVDCRR
jgi:mRNA-degrading endonuclease toxin of MazEF toxin-antitoxin module